MDSGGRGVDALGKTSLPVSFGDQANARTEYITFDVINLYYPYYAIFGKGFANKFNAEIHIGYLCMKIPELRGVLIVHGNQKEARNIERNMSKAQRNINCVQSKPDEGHILEPPDMPRRATNLNDEAETKSVPLEDALPARKVIIGAKLTKQEEEELLDILSKNKDIFTWSALDL